MCKAPGVTKNVQARERAVRQKHFLVWCTVLYLLVIPMTLWAEIFDSRSVTLVDWKDGASAAETNPLFVAHNDNSHEWEDLPEIFAGPVSGGNGVASSITGSEETTRKAKMKVLTCHVTTNTQDTMRTIFPWVSAGTKVAHIAYFEILNKSDFVKFKITLQGPEFSVPLVLETLTFGPQEPLNQWGMGFWKTYTVPGIYTIKMTAIPETNRTSGRSSVACSFRVSEPQGNH